MIFAARLVLFLPSAAGIVDGVNRRRKTTVFALISAGVSWMGVLTLMPGTTWQACGSGIAGEYLIDVWTADDGLPDGSVTAIAQTPDGYLWVGTYNGLARFDGKRFVTFDPANTPALVHAHIRKLYVDFQGTLWINTYDGSLTTLRQGTFTLERRNLRPSEAELTLISSSSSNVIFLTSRGALLRKSLSQPAGEGWEELPSPGRGLGAFCCGDGQGTIWYCDADKHFWRLRGGGFESVPESAGLAGQNINCLTTDPHGRLWAGTDTGFAVWDGKEFENMTPTNFPMATNVSAIAVTAADRVWVVAGGCVGEAMNRGWTLPPDPTRTVFGGTADRIGVQSDHSGGMWFYNYGRGLIHMNAAGKFHQLTAEDGFPGERVACFIEDREGDWWAGLDASGLVRVRETQFHAVAVGEGVLAKAARSVCEDNQGVVWIGMLSGGLVRWQDGAVANLAIPGATDMGSAFCICADADGHLWASAENEDLFLRENGVFKRITPVIHGVKSILVDHTGRVWVGTTGGLFFADRESPEDFHLFSGIARRSVRALAEDRRGVLWAGTGGGELYAILSNSVTMFHPTDNRESGAIWSLLADNRGSMWIGTFRGGLLRFQDGQFTRFEKAEGLPDNVICQILDDGRGNLWIGSHQGIFRVAKSALDDVARGKARFVPCIVYGRSDGLPSLECCGGYQPSACQGRDGRFWFTTVKGAVWIQPEELQPNLTPPPVVIEEVLVDGRVQTNFTGIEGGSTGLARAEGKSSRPQPPTLVIPPGKHQVEIRYTGLSLSAPDRVQFRYQMDGVDDDWVQAGTRRFAQYHFLPHGVYRFQVIACNSDGIWNHTGCLLALNIRPHFYETWWFRVLAAVLLVGTIAGTVRYAVVRRLRRKMEGLERQRAVERERARIAKDIHDDLGASLTLIAVLGDLAKKERTAERIEKMSGTARQAVKSLDEIVWAVNPRNDTLAHLIDYAGQFATGYLRDAGIRCLLDVPEQTPAREVPANVRHNVFLAIREALQNIVKHARATEVWLRISAAPGGLRISVEDNGCGFDRPPEDAWADGLRNMRQRLTEIGGQCRIQSRVGSGTTIMIDLPWPPG